MLRETALHMYNWPNVMIIFVSHTAAEIPAWTWPLQVLKNNTVVMVSDNAGRQYCSSLQLLIVFKIGTTQSAYYGI